MLRLLLLDAALHAAEGSVHALDEAVLDLLVVLLHLQVSVRISKRACPATTGEGHASAFLLKANLALPVQLVMETRHISGAGVCGAQQLERGKRETHQNHASNQQA